MSVIKVFKKVYRFSFSFLKKSLSEKYIDYLLHRYYKKFGREDFQDIFSNKSVAIIGPADSALGTQKGEDIDRYDLVLRINNGYKLLQDQSLCKDLGTRTDVLIHNMRQRKNKGEEIDISLLKKQSLQFFIGYLRNLEKHGKSSASANQTVQKFMRKFHRQLEKYLNILPSSLYREIFNILGEKKPTVGFIALYLICNSNAKKVFITGFTFFQTDYINGYRDYTSVDNQLERFSASDNGHQPNAEFEAFKKVYLENRDKIVLDEFLCDHLQPDHS